MTVIVPVTDLFNYPIQAEIATMTALLASNPQGPNSLSIFAKLIRKQHGLIENLMANAMQGSGGYGGGSSPSHLTPASILANCTINT